MRTNPSTVRGYFRQESRLVASLDQSRTPMLPNGIPAVEVKSQATTLKPPPAVSVRGQLTFWFHEQQRIPRLAAQTRHELAIARIVVAEKRYAPAIARLGEPPAERRAVQSKTAPARRRAAP